MDRETACAVLSLMDFEDGFTTPLSRYSKLVKTVIPIRFVVLLHNTEFRVAVTERVYGPDHSVKANDWNPPWQPYDSFYEYLQMGEVEFQYKLGGR